MMLRRGKGIATGLFNVFVGRLPSRRLRRMWSRMVFRSLGKGAFIGIRTQLMAPWNIELGPRAVVNPDCHLDGRGGALVIGEDTDIGPYTHIWTLQHDPNCDDHGTKGGDVTIGDHVWIASRVTILPGVTIGRGAVIAAGAVVTRDVAEQSIVGGMPAKVIGKRDNSLTYQIKYNPKYR